MSYQRNYIFDAVKAIAIFLVVYAHCFVYMGDFDHSNIFVCQLITAFHMPLFFVVSGFFLDNALRLGWKDFLLKKSIALLLPCFTFTLIYYTEHFPGWQEFASHVLNPFQWKLWFLRGLFLTQLVAYVCVRTSARFVKGRKIVIVVAILLSLLVYVLPFMSVPRVMMPMLWIGYLIRKHYEAFVKYHRWIGLAALTGFLLLLPFWSAESGAMYGGSMVKIYEIIIGKTELRMLGILIYRIAIGLYGSVAVIAAMHELKNVPQWITTVGASTAAIYILESFILEDWIGSYVAPHITVITTWPMWLQSCIIFPMITCIIIATCVGLRKFIYKNRVISVLLLGDTRILRD